jgi:MATE family multidrug resistance protein
MNKEILRLAIPNIISNVSVPLLSTVDTALMGHLSAIHLGAVGVASMIFNFIYWNFGFLRMGTTGMTAQAFGKKSHQEISHTLGRALMVSLGLAFILLIFQIPFEWISIHLMQVEADQIELVSTYFRIRIWAAPATLASYALLGWFFGMQNAIIPLYITILVNLINIGLSFLFIIHFGMGVDGVAWSTVIAQYGGLALAIWFLFRKYRTYLQAFNRNIYRELSALKRFFTINRDIFIRTLGLTLAFAFFFSQSAAAGTAILALNVILLQFVNWMSYGIDGFAFAAESMVGKYKGANSIKGVQHTIRISMAWGLGLAVLFSLIYGFFSIPLLKIFTDDPLILRESKPFLIYMVLFPVAGFLCYIWDGIYIGLTASKTMRNAMILSFIIFLGCYYLISARYGNHGLWIALLVFLLGRGLIQSILYRIYGWNLP